MVLEYKYFYLYNKKTKKIELYDDSKVLDSLYNLESSLPTITQVNEQKKLFKNNTKPQDIIEKIRISISKLENKVPLYDPYTDNLYLITKEMVYYRVVYQSYRFPEKMFQQDINKKHKTLTKKLKSNIDETDKILVTRKIRKYELMTEFLSYFDIEELYNTYIRVFYLYANEVGKNITLCQRPSFMVHFQHIKPYYSRSEVINLALNNGLKVEKSTDIEKLCQTIKDNDITARTLLQHQEYIIEQNKVGLIQYYSLHGSYIINQYLRGLTSYPYKNDYLESLIIPMWNLVANAPAFDKEYILYRFIHDDAYLRQLEIGDIFQDKGFTSTTRDPFYRSDLYKFGFILIKIKIPKNIKGIGLCVETLSHFPLEQEIILAPNTLLRLDKRDDKCNYYHTDAAFTSQVKTRYEFTLINNTDETDIIKIPKRIEYDVPLKYIDFLKLPKIETLTLEEKIRFFLSGNINPMYQFGVILNDKKFTIVTEYYDSTGAYQDFYAMKTSDGFSIYTIHNNYVLFFIELVEDKGKRYMHVNYYVQYSTIDRTKIISDEEFIKFVSSIAYYFEINYTILYADYITCDILTGSNLNNNKLVGMSGITINTNTDVQVKQRNYSNYNNKKTDKIIDNTTVDGKIETYIYGGNYCIDYYNYLKYNKKKYAGDIKILNMELFPKFSYHQLDKLKKTDPQLILNKEDKDELYQIYDKAYINLVSETNKHNIADFLLWVIENKCYLTEELIKKIERLYRKENTLNKPYYVLDPGTFLYNRRYINDYPQYLVERSFTLDTKLLNTTANNIRIVNRD
jgi:hypothetical protein